MSRIREYSISRRLTWMNMLVSGTALLIACGVLFTYDLITFRQSLVDNLSIQAQIVGSNSISALLFNDSDSATGTLSALSASGNIIFAGIYTPDGRPFAVYLRNVESATPMPLPAMSASQSELAFFERDAVSVLRVVKSGDQPAGTVYIRSDLQEVNRRLTRYMTIMAGVLLISLLTALLISSISRRSISEPIVRLANVAQTVSRDKDYSIRAASEDKRGEISVLIGSFNEMLGQIEDRDAALQKARYELEARVEERTAQLAAANKELEAFSYSVSHDLRAPLRHIDGFSSLLAEKYGAQLDSTAQRYLQRVREGARNMGQLVDDLLSMARIGRQELIRRPTDLGETVRSVIKSQEPECVGRKIEWRIEQLPSIDCDPGLMQLVFTNLISNAIKYTGKTADAVIELGQGVYENKPVVFVRDNGAGFEQKYVHKIFGVFQRLHLSEDFEGTGIGLATVQRIIHRHGGEIWAEGEVDKGATFYFTIPG